MKRAKLWKRGLFTAGISLSIFLSSFGNVTGVRAAELSNENSALELQQQDENSEAATAEEEENGKKENEEQPAKENDGETKSEEETDNSSDASDEAGETDLVTDPEEKDKEEQNAEEQETEEQDSEEQNAEEQEYTVTRAEVKEVLNRAPRDHKSADNANVNKSSVHDGAILQAFCWSFNTIADNMAAIADAGYTAVQTSPINECLDTNPGKNLHGPDGVWYCHYQPTDWVIGKY